jgi:hypothetical protein
MRRREFIVALVSAATWPLVSTLVGAAAMTWPLAARAQQSGSVRRIAVIMGFPVGLLSYGSDQVEFGCGILRGPHPQGCESSGATGSAAN